MKITTNLEEANRLLQSYKGATLQIAIYSESLQRMALRLNLYGANEVIYIVGAGCKNINGSFRLENINLSIEVEFNSETEETITKIIDKNSEFELITSGGFSMAQGEDSEFGNSFTDFLHS